MPEIIFEQSATLRGQYPDIPLPEDINLNELTAEGLEPFFVTLPLLRVGAESRTRSRNGGFRRYGEASVQRLVAEINGKRPEGGWGHLRDDERPTKYGPPAIRWLAARTEPDGQSWGKLIALTPEARDYYRNAKLTNARVGSSIYGTATFDGDEVVDLDLERIDIADPSRAGVKSAVAVPQITSEMQEDETVDPNQELIAELRSTSNGYQSRIAEMETRIAELEASQGIIAEMQELLPGDDLVAEMRGVITELGTLRRVELGHQVDEVIAEMVELDGLRPLVRDLLGTVDSVETARASVTAILERPHVQQMAKTLVKEMAGPGAFYHPNKDGGQRIDDTPENRQRARSGFGF